MLPVADVRNSHSRAAVLENSLAVRLLQPIKDIKILLFVGYAFSYVLAIFAPIVFDPILKAHVLFSPRHYPYAILCLPIYILLLGVVSIIFLRGKTVRSLYTSVLVYIAAIVLTFPIFLPEFPHGNVFSVGITSAFIFAFSAFVWSVSNRIMIADAIIEAAGINTLDTSRRFSILFDRGHSLELRYSELCSLLPTLPDSNL